MRLKETSSECVRVMFMVADILLDHLFVKSKYLHLVSSYMSHLKVSRHFRALSLHSSFINTTIQTLYPTHPSFHPINAVCDVCMFQTYQSRALPVAYSQCHNSQQIVHFSVGGQEPVSQSDQYTAQTHNWFFRSGERSPAVLSSSEPAAFPSFLAAARARRQLCRQSASDQLQCQ